MATAAEHKQKAEHNQRFLAAISDEFPDWLATVAFYVAVQCIERMLADRGLHSKDHYERKEAVRRHFPSLRQAYNDLYNASLVARYDPFDACLPVEDVRGVLIARRLAHVTSFTASHAKAT